MPLSLSRSLSLALFLIIIHSRTLGCTRNDTALAIMSSRSGEEAGGGVGFVGAADVDGSDGGATASA